MEISANMELIALLLTFVVHVIGAGVLIWALIDKDDQDAGSWRDWWPRDERPDPPEDPTPDPGDGGAERPIAPETQPSPVRLREPGRISERKSAPARRPAHPVEPARERDPA